MKPSLASRRKTLFKGDAARLVSGTAAAQAIGLLATPVLTRIFAPEAFGTAAAFAAIVAILSCVACLCYNFAIVLPEDDREAANVFGVCLICLLVTTMLTTLLVAFGSETFLGWFNLESLQAYVWLIPVSVFLSGLFTALNYWNTRTKHFLRLSITQVTTAVCTAAGRLGAGFAGYTTGGTFVLAGVAGQAIATAILGGQIARDNGQFISSHIRWREIRNAAVRYKKFPLFNTWSLLFNYGGSQLPALILALYFSPAIVGFYALGSRLLKMPMSLLGSAISQVFFQRASVAKKDGNLPQVILETVRWLTLIAAFPPLLLVVIGSDLFLVVFGTDWHTAGLYVQILAPVMFVNLMWSPIATLYPVLEKQEAGLAFGILMGIARCSSLVIGGLLGDVKMALLLYTCFVVPVYSSFYLYIISHAEVRLRVIAATILTRVGAAAGFVAPLAILVNTVDPSPLTVLLLAVVTSTAYYLFVIQREQEARTLLLHLFRRISKRKVAEG